MANYTFPSGSTLKALLEDPNLQVAPVNYNQSKKLKQEKEGGSGNAFDLASAAFLGPSLWDKTYDNADFNLEYMDLDEFLMENGGQTWPDPQTMSPLLPSSTPSPPHVSPPHMSPPHVPPPQVSPPQVSPPHASPSVPAMVSPQASPRAPLPPSPAQVTSELAAALMQIPSPESKPAVNEKREIKAKAGTSHSPVVDFSISEQDVALATIPVSPQGWSDREGINLEYAVSDSDLALATAEGEEDFDPRKRQFTEDELKPQPMIKKSKKIFVPSEAKDEKYWARRRKNNVAAKRSRDARRIKENQIAMRAAFLEKENSVLRGELETTRSENYRLKMALKKYEGGS